MGVRKLLVAAALMAMVNGSLGLGCRDTCRSDVVENGTVVSYNDYGDGEKHYCTTPTCSYGTIRTGPGVCQHCCDYCLKGTGESCSEDEWGYGEFCSSGLVCQWMNYDELGGRTGTCVEKLQVTVTPTIRTTQETTSEDNPVTETYWNLEAPWNTHKRRYPF